MKKILTIFISYAVPATAFSANDFGYGDGVRPDTAGSGSKTSGQDPITLQNPLKADSFEGFFRNVLSDVILPVSAIIGVVLIIWAGFKFVTSQGEPAKLSEAKKRLIYTLIGVGIVIASEVILDLLLNTIKELKV